MNRSKYLRTVMLLVAIIAIFAIVQGTAVAESLQTAEETTTSVEEILTSMESKVDVIFTMVTVFGACFVCMIVVLMLVTSYIILRLKRYAQRKEDRNEYKLEEIRDKLQQIKMQLCKEAEYIRRLQENKVKDGKEHKQTEESQEAEVTTSEADAQNESEEKNERGKETENELAQKGIQPAKEVSRVEGKEEQTPDHSQTKPDDAERAKDEETRRNDYIIGKTISEILTDIDDRKKIVINLHEKGIANEEDLSEIFDRLRDRVLNGLTEEYVPMGERYESSTMEEAGSSSGKGVVTSVLLPGRRVGNCVIQKAKVKCSKEKSNKEKKK